MLGDRAIFDDQYFRLGIYHLYESPALFAHSLLIRDTLRPKRNRPVSTFVEHTVAEDGEYQSVSVCCVN